MPIVISSAKIQKSAIRIIINESIMGHKSKEILVNGEMHNPPHPVIIIKMMHMEPMGISVTEAAKHLNVDRKTLSRVIN